jgi:ketosteroid isomerase-like protein
MAPAEEGEEGEVVRANDAFYDAFAARDLEAMDAIWAREHPVACLHPGWDALRGREEVMASWRSIMENAASPRISFVRAEAYVLGTAAFVIGYERIEGATLVATNVFVKEDGRWKLAHHHASPVRADVDSDDAPDPPEPPDPHTIN